MFSPTLPVFRVDAKDNSVLEEEEEQADGVVKNGLESGSREPQLPPFADQKKKVVLHTSQGRSLGLSIRGGREYDLGVYVSRYSLALHPLFFTTLLTEFVAISLNQVKSKTMNDR